MEQLNKYPKIAIVYLSFHCEPYIDDVVSALKRLSYPKDKLAFIIVDNPHPTHGSSVRYVEEHVMPLSADSLPEVVLLPQKENSGFAAGNNVGAQWAMDHGYEYVYFHNNDGFLASDALEPLVQHMQENKGVGIAQSMIMLHPETNLVNTSGNAFHYLGFGYGKDYRAPIDALVLDPVTDISYASGSGMMVRTELIKKYGGWNEIFWMYHEDIEWSFRLRSLGYSISMVKDSLFFHKYQFSRSIQKFYWMERNRFGLMLMYFKVPTLLLMLPMAIVLELGLWVFAFRNKTWKVRLQVYVYWLHPLHWFRWLKQRRKIQKERIVGDDVLLSYSVGGIHFQEKSMEHPLLLYVGNPIMSLYFKAIRSIVRW